MDEVAHVVGLAPRNGVDQHHGEALAGGLRGADATGLGHIQVGAVHEQGNVLAVAENLDPGVAGVLLLHSPVQPLVAAADHAHAAVLRHTAGNEADQGGNGAAAHAAGHDQQMAAVRGQREAGLGRLPLHGGVKGLTDGDAAGHQLAAWDALTGELIRQAFVGDEIGVQLALAAAGAAGVVCGHEVGLEGGGVPAEDLCGDHGGEDMGADRHIVRPILDVAVGALHPGGDGPVHQGPVPKHPGVGLGVAVSPAEQAGGVPVDPVKAGGDQLGDAGGNKAQGVHHLAVDSLASEGLLNRPAAGVVPLARVAAQDQNAHTVPLSFLRLCLSVV